MRRKSSLPGGIKVKKMPNRQHDTNARKQHDRDEFEACSWLPQLLLAQMEGGVHVG